MLAICKCLVFIYYIKIYFKESGSTRPWVKSARVSSAGSTRPGQVGLIFKNIIVMVNKASGAGMRQCLYIIII